MARPIKDNADYFSHDTSMRDDPKIKALRRKFKTEGYGIWCMLLESITDSDCFRLTIDYEIIAGDYDVDPDKLREVVEYCLKLGLLQSNTSETVIWSKTLDARMSPLLLKRIKAKEQAKEQPRDKGKFSSNTDEPDVSVTETPQSKVKESKAYTHVAESICRIFGKEYKPPEERLPATSNWFTDVDNQAKILATSYATPEDAVKQINGYLKYCKLNDRKVIGTAHKVAETVLSSNWLNLLGDNQARAPNEFTTPEVDKQNYTLEAWEQMYAYDLKHNEKFRKHFGYGKLSPSQPMGSHNQN